MSVLPPTPHNHCQGDYRVSPCCSSRYRYLRTTMGDQLNRHGWQSYILIETVRKRHATIALICLWHIRLSDGNSYNSTFSGKVQRCCREYSSLYLLQILIIDKSFNISSLEFQGNIKPVGHCSHFRGTSWSSMFDFLNQSINYDN